MSDSEDEGAFASADEGESPSKSKSKQQPSSNKEENKNVKKMQDKKEGDSPLKNTEGKDNPSTSVTEGRGKQKQEQQSQKRGKKKTKSGSKPTSPEAKEVQKSSPDSDPTSPAKSDAESCGDKGPSAESQKEATETALTPLVKSEEEKTSEENTTAKEGPESKTKQAGDVRKNIMTASSPESQSMGKREDESEGTQSLGRESQSAASEKNSGGGWGWGSWGSSILSAASTFTDQVGGGLSTIIDSVESSLGVPDPEEMAKSNSAQKDDSSTEKSLKESETVETPTKTDETVDNSAQDDKAEKSEAVDSKVDGGWFSSWGVADIAKKVQNTGKTLASKGQTLMTEGFDAMENLASGGIDVLESIGKKTYNTLSEHDPAFKKTREYMRSKGSRPVLSSALREAKDQAEKDAAQKKENEEAMKVNFETYFDEYQGIAHLEALEMLSNQSEKKVHSLLNSLSSNDLKGIKPILISIKEVFENEEEEDTADDKEQDFSSLVNKHLSELELGTAPDKLSKVHDMVRQWIMDFDTHDSHDQKTPKKIHQQAIQSLAELTSKGVEQFHKAGELILMQRDSDKDYMERAHSFARLTGVLCHEAGNLATKFTDCLNKTVGDGEQADGENVTTIVTNIYLEASNSSTYIQDAFQLLLPILQQAAIEHTILSRQS